MENDGFKLVTGKKASKKAFKKADDGKHVRVDGTYEDVEKAMKAAKLGMQTSGLGDWTVRKVESAAEDRKVGTVHIIGNGHFDFANEPGAHQLALFLEISRKFYSDVVFQEPACSTAETQWLEANGVKIRRELDTNIRIDTESDELTVLGIIHGEHELLNEILEYNWKGLEKNRNLIVFGNDYGTIDWELSRMYKENPRINDFFGGARLDHFLSVYEPHTSAFSSTVMMAPPKFKKNK